MVAPKRLGELPGHRVFGGRHIYLLAQFLFGGRRQQFDCQRIQTLVLVGGVATHGPAFCRHWQASQRLRGHRGALFGCGTGRVARGVLPVFFVFQKRQYQVHSDFTGAVCAFWAFGPLSAFTVSERSQKGILTEILERNGRFENGKMKPGTAALTEPEQNQVSSAILYLEKRNVLTDLLPVPIDSALLEYNGLLNWLQIGEGASAKINSLSISPLNASEPLDIRGFEMAYQAELNSNNDKEREESGHFFSLSDDGKMLEWRETKAGKSALIETFSLKPEHSKMAGKNG